MGRLGANYCPSLNAAGGVLVVVQQARCQGPALGEAEEQRKAGLAARVLPHSAVAQGAARR